jgi:tetratricopeptide (TPR) repeat protein
MNAVEQARKNLSEGQLSQAETLFREVLKTDSRNGPAIHGLGSIAFKLSKHDQAHRLFKEAVKIDPGNSQFLADLGAVCARLNRPEEALAHLNEAANRSPKNPNILLSRALANMEMGYSARAQTDFREVHRLAPQLPRTLNQDGVSLAQQGKTREAVEQLLIAHSIDPEDVSITQNLANAYNEIGNNQQALHLYQGIEDKIEGDFNALYNYGNILRDNGDFTKAIDQYQKSIDLNPQASASHINLANLFNRSKRFQEARQLYETAYQKFPRQRELILNYALFLERSDENEMAIEVLSNSLAATPHDADMLFVKGKVLSRTGQYSEALDIFDELIRSNPKSSILVGLYFERGICLDKLGQYEKAYKSFESGNSVQQDRDGAAHANKLHYQLHVGQVSDFVHANKQNLTVSPGIADKIQLTFFVGFPRSGTTLMEQVLKSRSNIITLDETSPLETVRQELLTIPSEIEVSEAYQVVRNGDASMYQQFRQLYLDAISEKIDVNLGKVHIVDKLPLNIVELVLVQWLFPDAKILVALRDPRDVCLSNFMQRLVLNNAMANFGRMEDVVNLYAKVMELWITYKSCLKLPWLEYRYEDLITDFEGTIRKVLDFLDEPFDDTVFDFQSKINVREVSTPSYRDVKRPLYDSAIGRWGNYSQEMAPYNHTLLTYVSEFGYPETTDD